MAEQWRGFLNLRLLELVEQTQLTTGLSASTGTLMEWVALGIGIDRHRFDDSLEASA